MAIGLPETGPLAKFIWGEERLKRRGEILQALANHPTFRRDVNLYALSRKDYFAFRTQQAKELIDIWFAKDWTKEHFLDAGSMIGDIPSHGQFRIFGKNLEAQMSPEQKAHWIPKMERFEITGCYAQTEMGHGSNLYRIETTATFDPATDEFMLNSPTVSSSKFWIGGLACWSTHAIVVARLIIKEKEYGNHLFIVQVRDLKTHEILPNITIFDQGEKTLGFFGGVDNGVMRFYDHRIPRSHMFAGSSSVSRDGTFVLSKSKKHSFASMVIIRGMMADELGLEVMKPLYAATKYAQFRRQFGASPQDEETRVVEYASVKYRLYPAISRGVASMLVGRDIQHRVLENISTQLENLHIETVGAKVYASEHGARDAELARLICGGHGVLASAGIGAAYPNLSAARTYEGDNFVISRHIGKAIVKAWRSGSSEAMPALSYLDILRSGSLHEYTLGSEGSLSWSQNHIQERTLEFRAALLAQKHIEEAARGKDTSYECLELMMAHSDLSYWRGFKSQLELAPVEGKPALEALFKVFALSTIRDGLSAFTGTSFLTREDVNALYLEQERAISGFDGFLEDVMKAYSFTEFEVDSVFNKQALTPYEAIISQVQKNDMNNIGFILPTLRGVREIWKHNLKRQNIDSKL